MIKVLNSLQGTGIAVFPERCVVVRNRNAHCRRCAEVCDTGAISFDDGGSVGLTIDAEKCVSCGNCTSSCPTTALEARNPDDAELLRYATELIRERGLAPVFACKPLLDTQRDGYDRSRVIEVGCLGRVEETELVALAALVASCADALYLAYGDCMSCPLASGRLSADCMAHTTELLLEAWGYASPLRTCEGLPTSVVLDSRTSRHTEDVDGLSRRDFFAQLKEGAKAMATHAASNAIGNEEAAVAPISSVTKVSNDGTLPQLVPHRHARLLEYLRFIGRPQAEFLDTRLWGCLSIDISTCTSCRMCATFCPTGAISRFDDPGPQGEMGIEHRPAACVQCRLCEDICPSKALSIRSEVSLRELVGRKAVRFVMRPPRYRLNSPDQIRQRMYDLLGGGQIYER
jgi:ferredoxin